MSTPINDLPALSVRRPYLAGVINLLIIIAGISAIFGVEVRELPDIDRPIVREVEAQAIRRDERALLLDVRTERLAQSLVEQVRGRVVPHDVETALGVYFAGDRRFQI